MRARVSSRWARVSSPIGAGTDLRRQVNVTAGNTYYIKVTGYLLPLKDLLSTGDFDLSINMGPPGKDPMPGGNVPAGNVMLQAKFTAGEMFYIEETIVTDSTIVGLGLKNKEKRTQHVLSKVTVKSTTDDTIVLEKRIEWWKSKVEGGTGGTGSLMEKATQDVVFVAHVTKAGLLNKFEGYDQVIKKATDLYGAAQTDMIKADWPQNFFSVDLLQSHFVLPPNSVSKGSTWRKVSNEPFAGLGNVTYTDDFVYDGKGAEGELISSKGNMTFQGGGDGVMIGGGVKVLKIDLKKSNYTRKIVYDAARGRLISIETTMPLSAAATVEANNQQLELQFDGNENRTLRLHAIKPLP